MAFREANLDHLAKFNSSGSMYLLDEYNTQLDQDIQERANKHSHKTFAPSALRCKRRSWFRLRGTHPDKPKSADRILEFTAEIGTACHSMIQERLIRALKTSDQFRWIDVEEYLEEMNFKYNDQTKELEMKLQSELKQRDMTLDILKYYQESDKTEDIEKVLDEVEKQLKVAKDMLKSMIETRQREVIDIRQKIQP